MPHYPTTCPSQTFVYLSKAFNPEKYLSQKTNGTSNSLKIKYSTFPRELTVVEEPLAIVVTAWALRLVFDTAVKEDNNREYNAIST